MSNFTFNLHTIKLGAISMFCASFALPLYPAQSLNEKLKTALYKAPYIVCIDGGGSKTELQILDNTGKLVPISKNGAQQPSCSAGSSNINTVGIAGIEKALTELFDGVEIEGAPLAKMTENCAVIAGFSGGAQPEAKEAILHKHGFAQPKIVVASDAGIASQLIEQNGILLIAGTGSIVIARKDGKEVHIGGLGRLIGDEGSGYTLGKKAIKAALEDEQGYGKTTALTQLLKTHFNVSKVQNVISPIHQGTITPPGVAAVARLVFEQEEQDKVATELIDETARELGEQIAMAIQKTTLKKENLYLVGGLFKSKNVNKFIDKIKKHAPLEGWTITNIAHENATTRVVQKVIKDTAGNF